MQVPTWLLEISSMRNPALEIGDRVGEGQISTTLDVYTRVLLSPEEVSEEAYCAALVVSPWCLD